MSIRGNIMRRMMSILRHAPADVPIEAIRTQSARFKLPALRGAAKTAVDANGVPSVWIDTPNTDKGKTAYLYLHGGGYVQESLGMHFPMVARICNLSQVRALHIHYRLAPEHPFPAALEDTLRAYDWLMREGYPPHKIIFAGDSAGGGLALAAMVKLRDDGLPLPAAAVLLSPWCDLTMNSERAKADQDAMMRLDVLVRFAKLYAAETPLNHPLISPIFADLHGLPPTLLQVGEHEMLLHDAEQVAARAKAANTPVEMTVYAGMWHVFQLYSPLVVPETAKANREIAQFVKNSLNL